MNCWNILDIEQQADLKAVKRAYAAKLKTTKPDEDPEGFQRLHAAYKQATRYAKHNSNKQQVTASVVESVDVITHEQVQTEAEQEVDPEPVAVSVEVEPETDLSLTLDEIPTESPADAFVNQRQDDGFQQELEDIAQADLEIEHAFLQQQWDELSERVVEVTTDQKTINDLALWSFLDGRDALLDLQFKSEFSNFVFDHVANRLNESKSPRINYEVFIYLDRLFLWSIRRDLLEDEFGHELVDVVMQAVLEAEQPGLQWVSPRIHQGEIIPAGYFARLIATLLDWIVLGFIAVLFGKMGLQLISTDTANPTFDFMVGILLYAVVAPIMEATPVQGTPGKVLFGMKVTGKKGRRLNILHALWRSLMFTLVAAGFKVTVWLHLLLRDHRLIHDRLSGSIVIKR
jgi:uncharacterized RDD family membrane protein YckC